MTFVRKQGLSTNQITTPNGYTVKQDASGNVGVFRSDGTELGYFTADRFIFVGQGSNKNLEINLNSQNSPLIAGDPFIRVSPTGAIIINSGASDTLNLNADMPNLIVFFQDVFAKGRFGTYRNISTDISGFGLPAIYGLDNRTGLTAVDASPKTLYPQSSLGQPAIAGGQLYRLTGRILATAGTTPSATYTLKWTEGGVIITKTLTISALDSDSDFTALIQPDANTSITAQLTAIGGTGTTVNVAASVERLA